MEDKVIIEFAKWITGHNEETIIQMYDDWASSPARQAIQVQALVSPMLVDNEKRFLRLLIRDKKEEYEDELKTDIDFIRAIKQESIVKMDLLLEKLQ